MFFVKNIVIENTISRYKARFIPNPDANGYLFYKDDYGGGAPCSTEMYEAYVEEFESFMDKKICFMSWWFWLMIALGILGMVAMLYYMDIEVVYQHKESIRNFGSMVMILPLSFIFYDIWKVYTKPVRELKIVGEIGRERHTKEEIINRRFRGMSYTHIIFGLMISGAGLYFDIYNISGDYDSPYMKYLFILGIVIFSWFGMKKYKAHQVDTR